MTRFDQEVLHFIYVNYRNEKAVREATPISIRWGVNKWHTEPQWLMLAFDHAKKAEREFALESCNFDFVPPP